MAEVKKLEDGKSIVVNKIHIIATDRSTKDIKRWRYAHINAESPLFANRTQLYDLYKDVELDGHLTGLVQKRVDAVLNKTLRFVNKGGKKVDEMDSLIESQAFRCLEEKLLLKKFWGLVGFEFIPGEELHFVEIPRKHIKPDLGIIAYEQSGQVGVSYTGVQNLWIVGDKEDLGLYLKCAPYTLYKKGNMADWAQYIEIFGQPIRVIKYDANDEETKIELQTVLDESGSSLALMIPRQADFEIMDGKISNANGELQDRFKDACDNELSVLVLGNTETTSNTNGGSNAKAKEQGKQQLEVTKSDIKWLINQLNSKQFIAILKSYGYPVDGGKFEFEKEVDLEQLSKRKDIDIAISQKVPIGDDHWYETYGIAKPDNYEKLKAKMEEERQAKLNPPQAAPPAPIKPKKKVKKLRSLAGFEDDFEIKDSDTDITKEIKQAAKSFLSKLYGFFGRAPR